MTLELFEVIWKVQFADNQFLGPRIPSDRMPDMISIQPTIVVAIHVYDVFVIIVGEHPREGAFQNAVPKRLVVFVVEMIQVQFWTLLVIWGVEVYQALSIAVLPLKKVQKIHCVQVENFK